MLYRLTFPVQKGSCVFDTFLGKRLRFQVESSVNKPGCCKPLHTSDRSKMPLETIRISEEPPINLHDTTFHNKTTSKKIH